MPVYICHKFEDVGIYSLVCLALDSADVHRWNPLEMSHGESIAGQLRGAIHACEVCVFIATRRSIESPWCQAELGAFWGAGKKVLVFIGDPDLSDNMLPPQFRGDLKVTNAQELIVAATAAMDKSSIAEEDLIASAEILILNDRAHLYQKTAEVLRLAKRKFLDTTWGPIAPEPDKRQAAALAEYLKERNRARDRGVECHELFAGNGRQSRIAAATNECKKGNFLIKVIDPDFVLPYMPDIAVADTEHIIISNVGSTIAGKFKYVYVRSEGLAQVFHDWYMECWNSLKGKIIGTREDVQRVESSEGASPDPSMQVELDTPKLKRSRKSRRPRP